MGLNTSLTSDLPLHSASTIRILSSDPNKPPRVLKRVRSNVVLDYHTYLTNLGIEGYSRKSNVLYGQQIDEYREGFILDYTESLPDTSIESFDFVKINETPGVDNNKYRFLLSVYLNNDEHTIGFYESDEDLEPILEYTLEQYSGYVWNYKVIRFQSANFTNLVNIVDLTEVIKEDETTRFDIGGEEIEKHNIQSPLYIKTSIPYYNQFLSHKGHIHNKESNLKLTNPSKEKKIEFNKEEFMMGVNYPKGYVVNIEGLSFKSLINNNNTHPFQSGTWQKV